MEQVRQINCRNIECDNWEEFPADMPRHKAEGFKLIETLEDNGAIYECNDCGSITESNIEDKETEYEE